MIEGLLVDLDGTVYQDGRPLPGVPEAVESLRERAVPIRFVTNTTRTSGATLLARLRAMGVPAEPEELFTPPRAAVARIRERGLRRAAFLLSDEVLEDFRGIERDEDSPDVVVVGDLGPGWDYERVERGFRWLMAGAHLLALQKNRYWRKEGRLVLDAGPWVAALEYATGVEAEVVGKPAEAFFREAASSMGLDPSRVAMVGDDPEGDVGGARRAGLQGFLVRTGKYVPGAAEAAGVRPDRTLDSLADLPRALFG